MPQPPSEDEGEEYGLREPEALSAADVVIPCRTGFITIRKSDELPPIPEHPVLLCPNCGYNLTGLTSRVCPECGRHFDLRQVRRRALGMESGEGTGVRELDLARDLRAMRLNRVRLIVAWSLIAAGFGLTFLQAWPRIGGGGYLFIQIRVAVIAFLLFRFLLGQDWVDALWKTGWITLAFGAFTLLP